MDPVEEFILNFKRSKLIFPFPSSFSMTLQDKFTTSTAQQILTKDIAGTRQMFYIITALLSLRLLWDWMPEQWARNHHGCCLLFILQSLAFMISLWSLLGSYRSWKIESTGFWNAVYPKLDLIFWHFEGEPLFMRLLAVAAMGYVINLIDEIVQGGVEAEIPMLFEDFEDDDEAQG